MATERVDGGRSPERQARFSTSSCVLTVFAHVEQNTPLPPSQCIPKGGAISASPSEPGRCANLFVQ